VTILCTATAQFALRPEVAIDTSREDKFLVTAIGWEPTASGLRPAATTRRSS
jgi:hypothetical protein